MSAMILRKEHPVRWIPVKDLDVRWAKAQRGLNERRARAIAANMDPEKLGVLMVTDLNGNGKHHVIDGQTRARAVELYAGENEKVPCIIVPADSPERAAELFLGVNEGRSPVSPMDRHLVAVTAGREANVKVQKILTDLGYKVRMGGEDGDISAITACLDIYGRHGGDTLVLTLRTIQEMWSYQRDSVHNNVVRGMAQFLAEHDDADVERLVAKVSKKYTPARLLGAAKTAREMFQGTISENVARVFVQCYNHGLRSDDRLDAAA